MQAQASAPTWEDVLELLQNPTERTYQIDVESNSTVDIEATEDKAAIAEFMNAMGQFISGIGPMVENGTMPFEAAKGMMIEIMRRFRFSKQVEEHLNMMQAPKQQSPEDMQKAMEEVEKGKQEVAQAQEQLKAFEEQIKDAARALEQQQTEFEFERKMAEKEALHRDQIAQLNSQARQTKMAAGQQVATTKMQALADKLSSNLEGKAGQVEAKEKSIDGAQAALTSVAQMLEQLAQTQMKTGEQLVQLLTLISEEKKEELVDNPVESKL
jgi:chromosome segregation ATPase